jgi:copper resistance protein D
MLTLTVVVHWVHVVAALVWAGGQAFFVAALWPALLRRPAEARALYDALGAPVGRLMGMAGPLVLLLGVLRGTWLGPVRSWGALVATSYGHAFLAAIVLTVALTVYGGAVRGQVETRVWHGAAFAPGAAAYLRRTGTVTLVGLAAIVGCMVLMRFGV